LAFPNEFACPAASKTDNVASPNHGIHIMKFFLATIAFSSLALTGCHMRPRVAQLTEGQSMSAERAGVPAAEVTQLNAMPIYKMNEQQAGKYIAFQQEAEPDLGKRVVAIGRKNIKQPYELYLLGEFPFETYDDQPMYCLGKSDCVVFAEHSYAMALSHDWPSFFTMLQRIRYADGQIGVLTRNHYT